MGITTGTRDAWNISYCCDLGKRYSGILDLAFLACSMAKQLRCERHHREVLRARHRGSGTRILPRVHRRLGPRGVQNDIEYLTTHQRDHECRGTAHNSVDAPFTT